MGTTLCPYPLDALSLIILTLRANPKPRMGQQGCSLSPPPSLSMNLLVAKEIKPQQSEAERGLNAPSTCSWKLLSKAPFCSPNQCSSVWAVAQRAVYSQLGDSVQPLGSSRINNVLAPTKLLFWALLFPAG